MTLTAVEFYSGLGGFAAAAREAGITVQASFDQNLLANRVYEANFALTPAPLDLERLPPGRIPEADLWWLSPPCTPFTVRGLRRDDGDPRARSFLALIDQMERIRPTFLLLENVQGFATSRVRDRLLTVLANSGYAVQEVDHSPVQSGIPMRRPRRFLVASRVPLSPPVLPAAPLRPLSAFLDPDPGPDLDSALVRRYGRAMNVVKPDDPGAIVNCITRGYATCMHNSGSYVRTASGSVRRLSPSEILRLLGFPTDYHFPDTIDLATRYRLLGNSLDVRTVVTLLRHCLAALCQIG
jgi:site-specific DNA-cytosine methylase